MPRRQEESTTDETPRPLRQAGVHALPTGVKKMPTLYKWKRKQDLWCSALHCTRLWSLHVDLRGTGGAAVRCAGAPCVWEGSPHARGVLHL